MPSRRRAPRGISAALVLTASLGLTGCSQGTMTAAERSRATTLPTPSAPGVVPQRLLAERVRSVLDGSAATVDEDLQTTGAEQVNRVSWGARGAVVDASLQTLTAARAGTEVFRSPASLLARAIGSSAGCWWQAGAALSRFDRPVAQEVLLLRSARATSGTGSLLRGSVSALALLRILGTDAELKQRGLLPGPGVRVPATFGVGLPGVLVTMRSSQVLAAVGRPPGAGGAGTWTLRYLPLGSAGPTRPSSGRVVPVGEADPGWKAQLAACNARLH